MAARQLFQHFGGSIGLVSLAQGFRPSQFCCEIRRAAGWHRFIGRSSQIVPLQSVQQIGAQQYGIGVIRAQVFHNTGIQQRIILARFAVQRGSHGIEHFGHTVARALHQGKWQLFPRNQLGADILNCRVKGLPEQVIQQGQRLFAAIQLA